MKPRDAEPLTPLRSVRGSVSIRGFLSGASRKEVKSVKKLGQLSGRVTSIKNSG